MRILVDADACPNVIKDILFRAAKRSGVETVLVANRPLKIPASAFVRLLIVPAGFDVADGRIVELAEAGDLVITADIPLAKLVVDQGALALNPRGELYTPANVDEHLARRNFLEELRSAGTATGGPPPIRAADRQAFAGELDRLLSRKTPVPPEGTGA